jgi:hypothetical protein
LSFCDGVIGAFERFSGLWGIDDLFIYYYKMLSILNFVFMPELREGDLLEERRLITRLKIVFRAWTLSIMPASAPSIYRIGALHGHY